MKVKTNLNPDNIIEANQLKVGEMMIVKNQSVSYDNQILLKCYDTIVSLTDPSIVFITACSLEGRRLSKGESITLIQE